MTTTVQVDKSPENKIPPASKPTRSAAWIVLACCILLFAATVLWWSRTGRELIRETVHPFRVTHINPSEGTMSLVHGSDRYVVRCAPRCAYFQPAGNYPMNDRGSALEYRRSGETVILPIIEETTTFDTTGGHG